jgi:hypothetical protein
MNDSELNDLLKSARVPDKSDAYWEKFPGQVIGEIEIRAPRNVDGPVRFAPSHTVRPWFSFLRNPALSFGLVTLALVAFVSLVTFVPLKNKSSISTQQLQEAQKYYREIESLFPNQLEAIVLDQSGPRLVLAKEPTVPNSPPLYVKICSPQNCQRFITFSGQQIHVNGESFDVLMDRQGHVLLMGRDTIWSDSTSAGKASNVRIEAIPLRTTT